MSPDLFAEEVLGLELDLKQRELLEAEANKVILNCARQWGKSTMAAAKAVHRAVFRPGALTLVISPGARQSAELVFKVRELSARAGERVKGDGENAASAVYRNGSRVVGLPSNEDTTRGFSRASLLIVDEAARVKDSYYHSMVATLSSGLGDLWLMSTPNGRKGFFWKEWRKGEGWLRVQAMAEECPRTSKAFLADQRRSMTEEIYRQEYECDFLDDDEAVFKLDDIHASVTRRVDDLRV